MGAFFQTKNTLTILNYGITSWIRGFLDHLLFVCH